MLVNHDNTTWRRQTRIKQVFKAELAWINESPHRAVHFHKFSGEKDEQDERLYMQLRVLIQALI